jgi:hypothetical protein
VHPAGHRPSRPSGCASPFPACPRGSRSSGSAARRAVILDARHDRLVGAPGIEALDAHRAHAQEKVAAAFAILDGHLGRDGITDEDWQLAGLLMRISDRTRAQVQTELGRSAAGANASRGKADAVREVIKADAVADAVTQRVGRRVTKVLAERPGEWLTASRIKARFSGDDRRHVDDALDALTAAGTVEAEPIEYRGTPGHQYRSRS